MMVVGELGLWVGSHVNVSVRWDGTARGCWRLSFS